MGSGGGAGRVAGSAADGAFGASGRRPRAGGRAGGLLRACGRAGGELRLFGGGAGAAVSSIILYKASIQKFYDNEAIRM